jgi:hypothetical protein
MATKKNNSWLLALGLFAIAAVPTSIAWVGAVSNHKPEVVITPAAIRDGYETVPASYDIVASPNYKWTHEGVSTGRMLIVFLIFVVGACVFFLDLNVGLAIGLYAASVIGGTLLGIGKYSFHYYDIKKYEKAIDSTTYEANKTDLDKIFEQ